MKRVLMITSAFPPGAGSGVFRTLKFVKYLPGNNWTSAILTVKERYNDKKDISLVGEVPEKVKIYRTGLINILDIFVAIKKIIKAENIEKTNNSSNLSGQTKKKGIAAGIKSNIVDVFTTPDKYVGWLIPGVLRGLVVIKKDKIDLIYSTSPAKTTLLIGLVLKSITCKPWIIDFRDPWLLSGGSVNLEKSKVLLNLENWLELQVMKRADGIITNTEYLKNAYIEKYQGIIKDKTFVITNGYDPQDFENMKQIKHPAKDLFTISHVGEFYSSIRRPDNFLKAVSELVKEGRIDQDSIRIVFVGGGEYVTTKEFKDLLNGLQLKGVVEIIGYLPHKESLQFMFNSDVLLLLQPTPITKMQVPAKVFEYIRTGNYILALAPDSATSDIVRKLKNGMVVAPDEINILKDTIHELYLKYKNNMLCEKTDQTEMDSFSRRILTKKLAGIFDDIVPALKSKS